MVKCIKIHTKQNVGEIAYASDLRENGIFPGTKLNSGKALFLEFWGNA